MPKIVVIYASGMGRTKKMAEAIANGAMTVEGVEVLLKDAYDALPADALGADAVILGGSTYNYKLIKAMDPFLKELAKLDLKGKVGVAFGSYGWSGEAVKLMTEALQEMKVDVIDPGLKVKFAPTPEDIRKSIELGRKVGRAVKQ